jgi:hypothetical protein
MNGKDKPQSSYEAFNAVDKLVSKPVLGSDGVAEWQQFKSKTPKNVSAKGVAPTAPLKKSDRAAGFKSWNEERANEQAVRKEQGEFDLNNGYTLFRDKTEAENAAKRKLAKSIEARLRPSEVEYYIAATTFAGWKFDYIFTTRDNRTGYFWDGTDSVKKLNGDLVEEPPTQANVDADTLTGQQTKAQKISKKKRKKEGPAIINDPNNPLEQVAALMQRKHEAEALPPGWEVANGSTLKPYYFNRTTGERTWEKPLLSVLPLDWSVATDSLTGKVY